MHSLCTVWQEFFFIIIFYSAVYSVYPHAARLDDVSCNTSRVEALSFLLLPY